LFLLGASDDILKSDNVRMIEHFVDCILSLDFLSFDWEQDFDGDFSSVLFIFSLEDM
jgi:hypothetical protein